MATITYHELDKLKNQLDALINVSGGRQRLFDIIYRLVSRDQQPYPSFFDPNMYGAGIGGIQPDEVRVISDARKNLLLSEDPAIKSLWFRVNYELADIIVNTEKLVRATTKDELRIIKLYANTLSLEDGKMLLDLLNKIEPAKVEQKFNLPGLTE